MSSRVPPPNGFGPPPPPGVGGPQVPLRPPAYAPTQMPQGQVPLAPQQPHDGRGAHASFGYAHSALTPEAAAPLARIFAGRQVDLNQFSDLPNILRSVNTDALKTAVTLDEVAKRLAAAQLSLNYLLVAPPDIRAAMLKRLMKGSNFTYKEALAALGELQRRKCDVRTGDPAMDVRQSIGRYLYATMGREPAEPRERQTRCERLASCIEAAGDGRELISLAKTARRMREPFRPASPPPVQAPHPAHPMRPMPQAPSARVPWGPPQPQDSPPNPGRQMPPVQRDPVGNRLWPTAPRGQTADFGNVVEPNIDRQVFEDVVVLMHVANTATSARRDLFSLVQDGNLSPQMIGWLTTATGIEPGQIISAFERFRAAVPADLLKQQEGSVAAPDNRTLIKAYLEAGEVNSVDLRAAPAGGRPLSDQFIDFVASAPNLASLRILSSNVHRRAKRTDDVPPPAGGPQGAQS